MRNLSRVLTGTINGASEVPDPGVRLTRGLGPATGKTTSRAVPPPFFTPLRRRAAPSGTDLNLADPRAYRRLAALIRQQIGDGTLQPGLPAPSITSLSQEHGHARKTCSKALRILAGEGMLARIPGLGYYVR